MAFAAERTNARTQAQAKAVLRDIHQRRRFFPKGGKGQKGESRGGIKICAHCGGDHWTRECRKPEQPRKDANFALSFMTSEARCASQEDIGGTTGGNVRQDDQ